MNALMKSGEFAALCQTTKETLRHYDRIGLLVPAAVSESGYKLYSPLQLVDFALVSSLQGAGCSLGEVGRYLREPSSEELGTILAEKIRDIERERAILLRKQRMLQNTLERVGHLQTWLRSSGMRSPSESGCEAQGRPVGGAAGRQPDSASCSHAADDAERSSANCGEAAPQYRIEQCNEEYYVETALPPLDGDGGAEAFIARVIEHFAFCRDRGFFEEVQETYRIERDCFLAGEYAAGLFLCNRVPRKVHSERLHVKPAGTYVKWLRSMHVDKEGEGSDEGGSLLFEGYDRLCAFLLDGGYCIVGDVYDTELSLYAGRPAETLYTELSVRVEEKGL